QFSQRPEFVLPDRAQITMTAPFMRPYTELLVQTCHRRGAYAIGGMAAFIPSRRDPQVNEVALARVREDKLRESGDGFDGTWIAHPDLVSVAVEPFARRLGPKAHQIDRQRPEVAVRSEELLDVRVPGGAVTEAGLRNNVSVGIQDVASGLRGGGPLQPGGGRGGRRDLALPGLAVDPPRRPAEGGSPGEPGDGAGDRGGGAGRPAGGGRRRGLRSGALPGGGRGLRGSRPE